MACILTACQSVTALTVLYTWGQRLEGDEEKLPGNGVGEEVWWLLILLSAGLP